jgi:hypothetical protein
MPTYIALTIDDLDAELKKQNTALANYADYTTRRARAYNSVLAQYAETLAEADDAFAKKNVYATPLTTGTAKIATTTGDIYVPASLPADFRRVAGDAILVSKAASADFCNVPRMTWASIVASGSSQTAFAFWEDGGSIEIYDKDGANFDASSSVSFEYYRLLDATQTTGTALDIKQEDFPSIVSSVLGLM